MPLLQFFISELIEQKSELQMIRQYQLGKVSSFD